MEWRLCSSNALGLYSCAEELRLHRHFFFLLYFYIYNFKKGAEYISRYEKKYNSKLDIINIGSAAAVATHATWSEYCATKAGVVMATKCWAEDGLYFVVISPGRTRTRRRKALFPDEDQNTLLEPADFAKVIMKAVKKEYPTGTHIIVRKNNVQDILNGNIIL